MIEHRPEFYVKIRSFNGVMKYKQLIIQILRKLNPAERNRLFHCSLFDPSAWEEMPRDFTSYRAELDERVIGILRKVAPKFCRRITRSLQAKAQFLHGFVYNGDLSALMIAEALSATKKIGTRTHKGGLPDLISRVRGEEVGIEIKRLAVAKDPSQRLRDEVLDRLSPEVWDKPLVLLLIFPELELVREDPMRVHMFLSGFRFLGDLIRGKTGAPARVLCKYIASEYSKEFSFDAMVCELAKVIREAGGS